MIRRQMHVALKKAARYFPVVSLTGPRQSGKTTLVRSTFPSYTYMSLEDPDVRLSVASDPRSFLHHYGPRCIIDEAQRVPDFFSYLQTYVDTTPDCSIILTGSQNFLLMKGISQSLAGRVGLLTLLPFSYAELHKADHVFDDFEDYAIKGSYPRSYDRNIPAHAFYSSYVQTYVERDVRDLSNISNLNAFHRFMKISAGRVGQILNYSTIATEIGMSVNTIKSWISILEASSLIYLLQPFHKNFNKRVTRSPKFYFTDTGLVCHLLGIESPRQLHEHYACGAIFENVVISEILKERHNAARAPRMYFWRDSNGIEVDCLIEQGDRISVFECKSARTIGDDMLRGIRKWETLATDHSVHSWLVYAGDLESRRKNVSVLSWKHLDSLRVLHT